MKRKLVPVRVGLATALLALGLAAVLGQASCSNQGEGERCNILGDNGGNDDCQVGLVCKPKAQLNGAQDDLCCPLTGPATVVACQAPGGGNVIPVPAEGGADVGTPDASVAETSTDAATDAASDATTDSASDAATDGASADASDDGG